MMRLFQTRIRVALLDGRDDDAAVDQLTRVWQDLSSFTSLLLDVSKREELRAHDRDVIGDALARLDGQSPSAPCPEGVTAALLRCEGLDAELDALLHIIPTVGTLRQCLQRLHHALGTKDHRSLNGNSGSWSTLL